MPGRPCIVASEPLIFELASPGRPGVRPPLPQFDAVDPTAVLPEGQVREALDLPEVSEIDVMRHFVRLSQRNHSIDTAIYPLGSCTMKYNPKINEVTARLPGLVEPHPYQPEGSVQGLLALIHHLEALLAEIAGFATVTTQPAAGSQGEMVGLLCIQAWLRSRGEQRTTVLVPDSAHGTNPATATMTGMQVRHLGTAPDGNIDLDELDAKLNDDVAALMLTLPTTLGLFEQRILEVTRRVHAAGGQVYGDGANMNAMLGRVRPGDLGIDVMHLNLHKTFTTPARRRRSRSRSAGCSATSGAVSAGSAYRPDGCRLCPGAGGSRQHRPGAFARRQRRQPDSGVHLHSQPGTRGHARGG